MAINQARSTPGRHRRAVGVFSSRRVAEQALHELRDSGFPMDRVSVITRDQVRDDKIAGAEVHDSVKNTQHIGNKADEGATLGAATGGALGGLTGLLVGLGTLAIPGVGPILLAGATATTLATTLAGGAIGAVTGGLLGALVGLGIPEERARVYHDRISQGDYLVIVDGSDEQIARAEKILHHRGIEEYGVYDAPVAHSATSTHSATPAVHGHKQAVGIFRNRQEAESAIADLRHAGFPLNQITLVSRHFDRREPFAGVDLHDRFDAASYHLPTERERYYHDQFNQGSYLVIVRGSEDEIRRAQAALSTRGIQNWEVYEANGYLHQPHSVADQTHGSTQPNRQGSSRVEQVSNAPNVVIIDHRSETR